MASVTGLSEGPDKLSATDTSATGSHFDAFVPEASIQIIPPATHFAALGVCKPAGAANLEEENDDPVCSDPAGTDRATGLNALIEALADDFEPN